MSLPRKRGKVKKKLSAAKKVVKKPAKKPASKKKKAKRPLSASTKPKKRPKAVTKPQRPRKQPEPSKKKKAKSIRRTPPKSVSTRKLREEVRKLKEQVKKLQKKAKKAKKKTKLKGKKLRDAFESVQTFLEQPEVADQFKELLIDKNLAELTKGMVETPESVILGHLVLAETLGIREQRSRELAAEYKMPLNEIYTLWLSPPTKDLF